MCAQTRATPSLLLPAQIVLHLLLGFPQQSSHLAELHENHSHSSCFPAVICLSRKSQSPPICCYHTVNSVDIYLFVVDATAAAFCMEGHSSGMIDYKHAGARRNIILECLDWICNNIQVGWFLLFNGIQRKLWFRFLRHNKPCHHILGLFVKSVYFAKCDKLNINKSINEIILFFRQLSPFS